MKLKFERYPGVSCLYVRGPIEANKFKVLLVGIDTILSEREEPIIVHLALAEISPQELLVLASYRKKIKPVPFPVYWISADRGVGEFKSIDLLSQRVFTNAKLKSIGTRVKLDDEIYLLHASIQSTQDEITKLGGTAESAQKIILENDILKAQKEALDRAIPGPAARIHLQKLNPSDDVELPGKTKEGLDELSKLLEGPVDL